MSPPASSTNYLARSESVYHFAHHLILLHGKLLDYTGLLCRLSLRVQGSPTTTLAPWAWGRGIKSPRLVAQFSFLAPFSSLQAKPHGGEQGGTDKTNP